MINKISNITTNPPKIQNNSTCKTYIGIKEDSFNLSFCANKNKKAGVIKFITNLFSTGEIEPKPYSTKEPTEYQKDLSIGIKSHFEENIPPQNFENIMSAEDFKKILPSFKEENFIFDESFDENTLYYVDLDYQTLFSSKTREQIDDLLEKVENHAKKYYEKTGKKFIFAVADKDNLNGLRQIIRTIGEEPEKYEHFILLPAIKIAYAHEAPTSKIHYENSEMLIYGINPFSKNLSEFIDDTIKRRKEMLLDFIVEIDELYPDFAYNILEFAEQNRLLFNKDYTVSNLYWRAREYAEGKGGDELKGKTEKPEELYKEAAFIMDSLGTFLYGEGDILSRGSTNIEIDDENFNKSIKEIFDRYSTHVNEKSGDLVSAAENTYKQLINCLSNEKQKPVLAFAAPYYLSHYFEEKDHDKSYQNVINFMNKTIQESNGMLAAFESKSPSYQIDPYVSDEDIRKFNEIIRENIKLHEVGGSLQNHKTTS